MSAPGGRPNWVPSVFNNHIFVCPSLRDALDSASDPAGLPVTLHFFDFVTSHGATRGIWLCHTHGAIRGCVTFEPYSLLLALALALTLQPDLCAKRQHEVFTCPGLEETNLTKQSCVFGPYFARSSFLRTPAVCTDALDHVCCNVAPTTAESVRPPAIACDIELPSRFSKLAHRIVTSRLPNLSTISLWRRLLPFVDMSPSGSNARIVGSLSLLATVR